MTSSYIHKPVEYLIEVIRRRYPSLIKSHYIGDTMKIPTRYRKINQSRLPKCHSFSFTPVSENEILDIIYSLKCERTPVFWNET